MDEIERERASAIAGRTAHLTACLLRGSLPTKGDSTDVLEQEAETICRTAAARELEKDA